MATIIERNGYRFLVAEKAGHTIGAADAVDLIGEALSQHGQVIVLPVGRLDPTFFRLRTGVAGEFIQKVINYRLKFAVIGDISAQTAESESLRDFVRECNAGRDIFFLPDMEALEQVLSKLR